MATSVDTNRFWRDLSVGRKLALSFGAVGVIVACLVGTMFSAINDLGDAAERAEAASLRENASITLQLASAEMRAEQLAYLAGSGDGREEYEASTRAFESALDDLRPSVQSPVDQSLIAKIATGYRTFLVLDQFVWNAVQTGDSDLANNLALGPAALNFGIMAADADKYTQATIAVEADARRSFHQTRNATLLRSASIGLFAAALVVAASRYITKLIRDPLADLHVAAEKAASGDLDIEAPVRGNDETGRLAAVFNLMLSELRRRESALLDEHQRQAMTKRLDTALERADAEEDACGVVSRVLSKWMPDRPSELLLADNSRAPLRQVAIGGPDSHGPGCRVPSPYECPAVRSAKTLLFTTSDAVDACPHLINRPEGSCSSVCVPVSFMGRSVGVLHSTGENNEEVPSEDLASLTSLADAAGARIGVIRSTKKTQMQASTDALTGLPNRRTFEARVRSLHQNGESFTLVMADLDHFKMLNDTHGHEAGDRALRVFSDAMQGTVRDGDVVSRWGGEEFTMALIGTPAVGAADLLDRLREKLAELQRSTGVAPFTASYGYIEANRCETFERAIRLADKALYEAKAEGRDRAVRAEPTVGEPEPHFVNRFAEEDELIH